VERIPPGGADSYIDIYSNEATLTDMTKIWSDKSWIESRSKTLDILFSDGFETSLQSEKTVLEIGCAHGEMLELFHKRGWHTIGYESGEHLAEKARESTGLDIRTGIIGNMDLPKGSFDCIAAFHVLEHLKYPSIFFEKSRKWLKSHGRLVVEIPNPDLAGGSELQCSSTSHGYCNTGHMHFFTDATIKKYFQRFGFTVQNHHTWLDHNDNNRITAYVLAIK